MSAKYNDIAKIKSAEKELADELSKVNKKESDDLYEQILELRKKHSEVLLEKGSDEKRGPLEKEMEALKEKRNDLWKSAMKKSGELGSIRRTAENRAICFSNGHRIVEEWGQDLNFSYGYLKVCRYCGDLPFEENSD